MRALDKQIAEARKCVLLCANCHRGVHAGYYTIPEDYTKFFDEDIAQQLLKENEEIKNARKVYCKQCGKLISKGANKTFLCQECYKKYRQDYPPNIRPPRIVLKHLIRKFPMTVIGQMYRVTDNTIRRWCKAVNLPYKKHIILSIPDEAWKQI